MDNNGKTIAIIISISLIVCLVLIYLANRSTDKIEYDTNVNWQELVKLQGKTLAVFPIYYNDTLLGDTDPPAPNSVDVVVDYQKGKYITALSTLFEIVDLSNEPHTLNGIEVNIDQPEKLKSFLREAINADGGILINNCYGFDPLVTLEGDVADFFLPKDWAKFVDIVYSENSSEAYYIVSDMKIVNKNGDVIWNFFGKATKNTYIQVDPTQDMIVNNLEYTIDNYTDYIIWLLNEDLKGSPYKNYYKDYLDNRLVSPIHILPYSNINGDRWVVLELWDTAKSGDWGSYGQWPQAKSAFIIWISSLTLFVIALGLKLVVKHVFSDERIIDWVTNILIVPMLMFFSIVGWLLATFYLLRAIL